MVNLANIVRKAKEGYKLLQLQKAQAAQSTGMPVPIPQIQFPSELKAVLEEKEEEVKFEGFEIPQFETRKVKPGGVSRVEEEKIELTYPLIPKKPKKGERVLCYAKIFWDPKLERYVYHVIEPKLSPKLEEIFKKIKELLEQKLEIDFLKVKKIEAIEYLKKNVDELISFFGLSLSEEERQNLYYYIERDFAGLGKIEPLMVDDEIEDISCDGLNTPIYVFHRNPKLGSLQTNIIYTDPEELDSFIIRLAQLCGKSVSVANPLTGGTLPDGSRLQAMLATDIARKGSNFTIRKFTHEPLTPVHLLNYGTVDVKVLAYLWFVVDMGRSILVSGGTASGKTTLLNVLSLFLRPERRIVSIEETAELKLPHPHWVPSVARTPMVVEEGKRIGEVDLFDLLRESLRQRPDHLIVGEVRGKEAYVLFQQMASIPGNEKVLVLNDKHLKRVSIKKIRNTKNLMTFTIDPVTEKVKISKVEAKVVHPPQRELFKVRTKTGREVIATGFHSLFTYSNGIKPIEVEKLRPGDKIVIPAKLPCGFNDLEEINLVELMPDLRVYAPHYVKLASKKLGFKKASRVCGVKTISNYYGVNKCAIPAKKFIKLMKEAKIDFDWERIKVRFSRRSSFSKAKIKITPEFLRLLGYFIAEGSLNFARKNNQISLYNKDEKILKDMRKCIKKVIGKEPREREVKGYSKCKELSFSHKTFFEFFKRFCGCSSYKKKIPDFIFGLSEKKIGEFLSALYLGDGSINKKQFSYWTTSKELANDLLILLLSLGIIARVKERKGTRRKIYQVLFYRNDFKQKFLKCSDLLGKDIEISDLRRKDEKEIFLDEVTSIELLKLKKPVPVYDLSVPGTENFIGGFGGIMLHNTGHPSLSTIHAENWEKLMDRLTSPPIALPVALLASLDIVVFMMRGMYKDKHVRRVTEVVEIVGLHPKKRTPVINTVFKWNSITDKFDIVNKSHVLKKISETSGLTEEKIKEELQRRMLILNWLKENNITDYKDVYHVITSYYNYPERVISAILEGG